MRFVERTSIKMSSNKRMSKIKVQNVVCEPGKTSALRTRGPFKYSECRARTRKAGSTTRVDLKSNLTPLPVCDLTTSMSQSSRVMSDMFIGG